MVRKLRQAGSDARTRTSDQPALRLVRDAVEAEEVAVEWLRWVGVHDARRVGTDAALGIRGQQTLADVSFDPLPLERDVLADLLQRGTGLGAVRLVSFSFAGWSPTAIAWADEHGVALVRFTFAGSLDPSNAAARQLHRSTPGSTQPRR